MVSLSRVAVRSLHIHWETGSERTRAPSRRMEPCTRDLHKLSFIETPDGHNALETERGLGNPALHPAGNFLPRFMCRIKPLSLAAKKSLIYSEGRPKRSFESEGGMARKFEKLGAYYKRSTPTPWLHVVFIIALLLTDQLQ